MYSAALCNLDVLCANHDRKYALNSTECLSEYPTSMFLMSFPMSSIFVKLSETLWNYFTLNNNITRVEIFSKYIA